MGFYKIADRIFEIRERYDYIKNFCSAYAVEQTEADYVIEVGDEEIKKQQSSELPELQNMTPEYAEILAVYTRMTELLYKEDCFLFHAAVITFDGKAYAFTAPSGTGKTTHIKLWRQCFGDRVNIVNGDKPLIRRIREGGSEKFIAYGTPWSGKERFQRNTSAELCGICIVNRGDRNEIERIPGGDAAPELFMQLMRFSSSEYMSALLDMMDGIARNIPIYRLHCNMERDAAYVSCRAMTGADI